MLKRPTDLEHLLTPEMKLNFLSHRRRIIALDEWGWYLSLFILFFASFYHLVCLIPFVIVVVYGALCMHKSYKEFWALEKIWLDEIVGK